MDAQYQQELHPPTNTGFIVKDSGTRQSFAGGMVRDVTTGKTDFSLILDGPMFDRWATHLTKGAQKYAKRNWMLAQGDEEYSRFKESALRHFVQWYRGETDEDHAAAVFFNINGAEYVKANNQPVASLGPVRAVVSHDMGGPSVSAAEPIQQPIVHSAVITPEQIRLANSRAFGAVCGNCKHEWGVHDGLTCPQGAGTWAD